MRHLVVFIGTTGVADMATPGSGFRVWHYSVVLEGSELATVGQDRVLNAWEISRFGARIRQWMLYYVSLRQQPGRKVIDRVGEDGHIGKAGQRRRWPAGRTRLTSGG